MKRKILLFIFIFLLVTGFGLYFLLPKKNEDAQIPTPSVAAPTAVPVVKASPATSWIDEKVKAIQSKATNLNVTVLKTSLKAYQKAKEQGVTANPILTIIDYSKPSSERRLWTVDVVKEKVLFNTVVAHGKNSGMTNSSSFSNKPNSLKSSIGVFLTDETYNGKNGYSLRVQGLEQGINDNALDRAIVFHGANYVNPGRVGRSFGCMAVSRDTIAPLVKTIKDKSLVVAYYPDKKWLNQSAFLT